MIIGERYASVKPGTVTAQPSASTSSVPVVRDITPYLAQHPAGFCPDEEVNSSELSSIQLATTNLDQFENDFPATEDATSSDLQSDTFNILTYINNHIDLIKGDEVIKIKRIPLDLHLTWLHIHESLGLPIGLSLSSCLLYSIDLIRDTPEYHSHVDTISRARRAKGLDTKRKLYRLIGSSSDNPALNLSIDTRDGQGRNLQFKSSDHVRTSLSNCAASLAMRISVLGSICIVKGLVDAKDSLPLDPEFIKWGESLYDTLIHEMSSQTRDVIGVLKMFRVIGGVRK